MIRFFRTLTAFIIVLNITLPNASFAGNLSSDNKPSGYNVTRHNISSHTGLNKILNANKGKVIYLDFWASWCTPCRKSFPWMNKIQSTFDSSKFTVISINVDQEMNLATKFLKENPANFPVIYDPKGIAAKAYAVKGMPSSYLINQQGEIVKSHTGFFTSKIQQYENEISQLITVNVPQNKG